jgi:hypothetical protein
MIILLLSGRHGFSEQAAARRADQSSGLRYEVHDEATSKPAWR